MRKGTLIKSFFKHFRTGVKYLYEEEYDAVNYNTNERCMMAIIYAEMQKRFKECAENYKVDYEYNREGRNGDPKTLSCQYETEPYSNVHRVIPDLIFHKRGDCSGNCNLCVLEAKKIGVDPSDDIIKLKEMTRQDGEGKFKYKIGCHIVFGETANLTKIEVFINGKSRLEGNIENMEGIINESLEILIDESII